MAAALVVNVFTVDLVEFFGGGNAGLGLSPDDGDLGRGRHHLLRDDVCLYQGTHHSDPAARSSLRQDVSGLLRNGPWIALFLLAVLIYIQLALRSGTMLYYFNYYLKVDDVFSWINNFGVFNGVGLVFTIVGVILAEPLTAQFGKRATFQICLLVSSVLDGGIRVVPPDSFRAPAVHTSGAASGVRPHDSYPLGDDGRCRGLSANGSLGVARRLWHSPQLFLA